MFTHRVFVLALVLISAQISWAAAPKEHIIRVAPAGGDFTSIQAALDSIFYSGPNSRYLIQVAPGTYNESFQMREYVRIHGSGQDKTIITAAPESFGTVRGADHSEIGYLTVESTGGEYYSVAIFNDGVSPEIQNVSAIARGSVYSFAILNMNASPKITHVKAKASDATAMNLGIANEEDSNCVMKWVEAEASGGVYATAITNGTGSARIWRSTARAHDASSMSIGVANFWGTTRVTHVIARAYGSPDNYAVANNNASPVLRDVTALAEGGYANIGVYSTLESTPVLRNVRARATGTTPSVNIGVANQQGTSATLQDVDAIGQGEPGTQNWGMSNTYSSATAEKGSFEGAGGSQNCGIWNFAEEDEYFVELNKAKISGSTNTIFGDQAFTVRVTKSELIGGPVDTDGGIAICSQVWDENHVYYSDTCP